MIIHGNIKFPKFTGIKCSMMPFIQGDPGSLPDELMSYSGIIKDNFLEFGEIGHLTIDESLVREGSSQRGYSNLNGPRNVHIEVGAWQGRNVWGGGGGGWGGGPNVFLEDNTQVLIANSIDDTCRIWDIEERSYTDDGDLGAYLDRYHESDGIMMKAGQLVRIGIFTPHECLPQKVSLERQFIRIVGKGVHGRESYFTINNKLSQGYSSSISFNKFMMSKI